MKKIIVEEINDFEWAKNVSFEETLDDIFGIHMENGIVMFNKDRSVKEKASTYQKLINASGGGLHRKLNKGDFRWYKGKDIIEMFKSGRIIDRWRDDRITNIEENYPKVYRYYLDYLMSWG